ncbi:hypothetical protein PSV08DRAFT_287327 [Bipolaris maydis]|nr:hypothetical protein PSV08DRAFT_287327 [Bipolaris maydis]
MWESGGRLLVWSLWLFAFVVVAFLLVGQGLEKKREQLFFRRFFGPMIGCAFSLYVHNIRKLR